MAVEEDGVRRNKRPDYSFKAGTQIAYYLEAKKPAVNLQNDTTPAFQLRRYGWSGNLRASVLTNFEDLYIYDCAVRPMETDGVGTAQVAHYHFTEYSEKIEEIYLLLSKESVQDVSFFEMYDGMDEPYRREPFNAYFLEQIRTWRLLLGRDINRNQEVDIDTLNMCVQRILNRIIFMRICEDRSFERYETLKSITTYDELKRLFIALDQKYDSGLFAMLDEDSVTVSDEVLISIFIDLYYPNSSYEFSVVDPYMIGQIYELFLDEALFLDETGEVIAVGKPEVVDSQGAVNTPKAITDIIVSRTLSTLFSDKPIDAIENLTIADICCGSGNFLLSAFEFIVNYYMDYFIENDLQSAIERGQIHQLPGDDCYVLSYEMKRKVLTNNLRGVDIDPLAVEVTKFSLLLKLLEQSGPDEVDAFVRTTRCKILPNLDNTIRNGNALIDSAFSRFDRHIYEDYEKLVRIKMFDCSRYGLYSGVDFDRTTSKERQLRIERRRKAEELAVDLEQKRARKAQYDEAISYLNQVFYAGAEITHKKFGNGKIVSTADNIIRVQFSEEEPKNLGLAVAAANGIISVDTEGYKEKLAEYQSILKKNGIELLKNVKGAEMALEPYLEYLE